MGGAPFTTQAGEGGWPLAPAKHALVSPGVCLMRVQLGHTLPQGVQYYPVQHLPTTAMPQGAFNPHFGHQPSVVYRSDLHADPYPPGHGDQGRYNAVV